MIPIFDAAGPGLVVDAALRGSVVLLAAFGVTAMMRRAPAAARHLVWTLALGGVLIIPLLGSVLPAWPVVALPPVSTPVVSISAPGGVSLLASWETMAAPRAVTEVYGAEAAIAPASRPGDPLDLRWLVVMLWGAGVGLLSLRLLTGVVRVRWIARRATPVDDPAWLQLTLVLARRFGLARPVTLLRSESGSVPMTWGTVYPVVLLPADADGWSTERRTVVLAHELAHVRRWDAATQWMAHLALALYWFNPLVWIAARRLRDERERACDDAVLAAGTRPTEYADHLLDIVRSLGTTEGPVAALAMARRSQFEGRLLAILDRAVRRDGVSRSAALGTALLTAAVIVPLAALRAAEPPAEAVTEASNVPVPPAPAIVTHAPPVSLPEAIPDTVKPILRNPQAMQTALMALYLPLLRDAGITGTALLEVVTDKQGRVQESRVVRASHEAFGEVARQAAASARFSPARSAGEAVPFRFTLPVHFDLPPPDADLPVISSADPSRVAGQGEGGIASDPWSEDLTYEALQALLQKPAESRSATQKKVQTMNVMLAQVEETHALIRRVVEDRYPEVFSHGLSRDKYLWFLVGPSGQIEKTGVETVEWGWNGWSSTSIRRTLQSKFPEIQIQHSYHTVGPEMGGSGAKVNVAWITRK